MSPLRLSRTATHSSLASLAIASLLVGCASLLGDFTADPGGSAEGGADAAGPPVTDTGSGSDVGTTADTGVDAPTSVDATGSDAADASDGNAGDSNEPDSNVPDSSDSGDAANGPDAADAADAAEAAAAWTPATLDQANKLALWLEASNANLVISTGVVEGWNDLSHYGNNAANSNAGPTVAAAAIHGHDALNFSTHGLALAIADATSLQFGTDQIYLTAVTRATAGSPYFFAKFTSGFSGGGSYYSSGLMFFAAGGTDDAGASIIGPAVDVDSQSGDEVTWDSPGLEDGKFHIVGMRRTSSSSLELTVDDQAPLVADTGSFDVSQVGKEVYVGSVAFGSINPTTNVDIAEIVAVHTSSGVVADADVTKLHAYLKQKYGL